MIPAAAAAAAAGFAAVVAGDLDVQLPWLG
jgi:hypothetical protein